MEIERTDRRTAPHRLLSLRVGVLLILSLALVLWALLPGNDSRLHGGVAVDEASDEHAPDRAASYVPASSESSRASGRMENGFHRSPISRVDSYTAAVRDPASTAEAQWAGVTAAEKCHSIMFGGEASFLSDWKDMFAKPGQSLPREITMHIDACEGFADIDAVLLSDIEVLLRKAAASGSVPAQIRLLATDLASGRNVVASEASALVSEALSSEDPAALWELAGAVSNMQGENDGELGAFSGLPQHEYAWRLAACDRGFNCGPTSDVLQSVCVIGGYCGYASYEDFLRSVVLSPAEYAEVVRMRQQLLQLLASKHSGAFAAGK